MRRIPERPMLWIIRSAFVQVAALYVVVIVAAMLAGRDWIGWVVVAMLVFAILNPLARAFGAAWWAETALSGVSFLAVVPLCSVIEALGIARLTEDAMAVLGPLMLYLVAVPVSGALRYVRHRRWLVGRLDPTNSAGLPRY
jgi:hypothetical protein